jgi:hypothetical protein
MHEGEQAFSAADEVAQEEDLALSEEAIHTTSREATRTGSVEEAGDLRTEVSLESGHEQFEAGRLKHFVSE